MPVPERSLAFPRLGPGYIAPAAGTRKPRVSTDCNSTMNLNRTGTNLLWISILWLALAATGQAAERMYKWVDANGQVQYSNRMPPEAARREREELSQSGRVIKVYNAPLTPEQKAEARQLAELEKIRKERERKRVVHDRSLLASYTSKQDMISAQQNKINMVDALIQLTHSRINAMQERMHKLTEEAAGYERSGKHLPFSLKQQLRNLRDQIEHNTQFAADKETEIKEIRKQFELDIARYEELTASQAHDSKPHRTPLEIATSNPDLQLTHEDRALLTMYSSENDLKFARNDDLEKLDADIKQAFTRVDVLQKNLSEMTEDANGYEADGKPVPESLVNRMKETTQEISRKESELQDRRKEKQQAEARYKTAIERFRYLTGGAR